jgi:hypothetical protein
MMATWGRVDADGVDSGGAGLLAGDDGSGGDGVSSGGKTSYLGGTAALWGGCFSGRAVGWAVRSGAGRVGCSGARKKSASSTIDRTSRARIDSPSKGLTHIGADRLCLRGFLRTGAREVVLRAGRLLAVLRRGFFPLGFRLVAIMVSV